MKVMEGQLRKRMQQVKELFSDCTDVFEELIAVKTHLAEKIEECHSAVENIQSSLNEVDASEANVEEQIQVHGPETTPPVIPWHQFTKREPPTFVSPRPEFV